MPEYIYLIHPFRAEMTSHPSKEEEVILKDHLAYLEQAAAQGGLLLAGSSLDGIFDVVIFRAEDDKTADQFMFNDPVVSNGLMAAELHPFRVSVRGEFSALE